MGRQGLKVRSKKAEPNILETLKMAPWVAGLALTCS